MWLWIHFLKKLVFIRLNCFSCTFWNLIFVSRQNSLSNVLHSQITVSFWLLYFLDSSEILRFLWVFRRSQLFLKFLNKCLERWLSLKLLGYSANIWIRFCGRIEFTRCISMIKEILIGRVWNFIFLLVEKIVGFVPFLREERHNFASFALIKWSLVRTVFGWGFNKNWLEFLDLFLVEQIFSEWLLDGLLFFLILLKCLNKKSIILINISLNTRCNWILFAFRKFSLCKVGLNFFNFRFDCFLDFIAQFWGGKQIFLIIF